ncbi:MAG: aminotransferase class V-fold PLP-dependent enzyme [Acidimicrobiales bacterium]|nr:aminotransferase class V-fold PLP-dependent enzyme [Acidimicrobiales bacterium]
MHSSLRLDIDFVRSQFAAFEDPALAGWAHCENAGGSYVPDRVADILCGFYRSSKVQPYGPAGPAKVAGDAMDRGLAAVSATLNAPAGSVSIGPSTTQNTYVVARALRPLFDDGDRVIVTNQDHEANIGSWRRLSETGIEVVEWSVDPDTGLLDVADLEALLTDRTRLVCFTHASNLAATVNPVAQVADLAHAAGALVAVDGVSYAPHAAIDVVDLDVDLYFYSTYKTWGPHQGVVYCRPDLLDRVSNQGHFFNGGLATKRLVPAGPDHAQVAAVAGMVDYYDDLYQHHHPGGSAPAGSFERIAAVYQLFGAHEQVLMGPLLDFLAQSDVRLVGSPSTDHTVRAPTIAFVPRRVAPSVVVEHLAARSIGVGHGDFYARRLVEAMGIDLAEGVVRVSLVHYNTVEEVDRVIAALDEVI